MEETMRTLACLAVPAVCLAFAFSASRARAEVYRCVLDGGHISYQQMPCDAQSQPLDLKDQPSGWSPLRPGERKLLNSYLDKDAARRRQPADRPGKPATESTACWKKRKQLEAVRARLHRGYKLQEGDALHRKHDDYQDYLRQFCS
jgi:hypothetical protein